MLVASGSITAFWNRPGYRPAIRRRLYEVYRRVALGIAKSSLELGTVGDDKSHEDIAAVDDSGRSNPPRSAPIRGNASTPQINILISCGPKVTTCCCPASSLMTCCAA